MKNFFIFCMFPFILIANPEMKCAPGKCGGGKALPTKKVDIPKNEMKCAPGKCAGAKALPTKKVDVPKNEMKCAPGKCAGRKDTTVYLEKVASKNTLTKPTVRQLFNVQTIPVKEQKSAQTKTYYGFIAAKDSNIVDVTAWYTGFVHELIANTRYFKVTKGDPLAKVYSPDVYKAKQDYLNSINYNNKTAMPQMLQSAKTKLTLLGIDEKEIEEIKREEKVDYYTTIYAPIDGWVISKNINQGSSFNTQKNLFQIVNLKQVWVEAKIFQEDIENLDAFENYSIEVKGLNDSFSAKHSLLYPVVDKQEATITLRLEVDNAKQLLKPGMYTTITASTKERLSLVIPKTAAIRKNGKWYAFLATEFKGEYEPVEIKVNPLDNEHFEVIKGLRAHDNVVNNALFMMDADAQINSIY